MFNQLIRKELHKKIKTQSIYQEYFVNFFSCRTWTKVLLCAIELSTSCGANNIEETRMNLWKSI